MPSVRYKTGKFIARHRAAAATQLVASLLAGTIGTTMLKNTVPKRSPPAEETSDFLLELFVVPSVARYRATASR